MALANGHLMPCGICKNFFLASSYQQPKAKIRRVKWRFRKCDKHNGKILTATNKFSGLIYFPNWTLNCCVKTLFLFSLQRSNYAMVILFWKFLFCLYMRVCLFLFDKYIKHVYYPFIDDTKTLQFISFCDAT